MKNDDDKAAPSTAPTNEGWKLGELGPRVMTLGAPQIAWLPNDGGPLEAVQIFLPAGTELRSAAPAKPAVVRTCTKCGCTDTAACTDTDGRPCSWVGPALCSKCAGTRTYGFVKSAGGVLVLQEGPVAPSEVGIEWTDHTWGAGADGPPAPRAPLPPTTLDGALEQLAYGDRAVIDRAALMHFIRCWHQPSSEILARALLERARPKLGALSRLLPDGAAEAHAEARQLAGDVDAFLAPSTTRDDGPPAMEALPISAAARDVLERLGQALDAGDPALALYGELCTALGAPLAPLAPRATEASPASEVLVLLTAIAERHLGAEPPKEHVDWDGPELPDYIAATSLQPEHALNVQADTDAGNASLVARLLLLAFQFGFDAGLTSRTVDPPPPLAALAVQLARRSMTRKGDGAADDARTLVDAAHLVASVTGIPLAVMCPVCRRPEAETGISPEQHQAAFHTLPMSPLEALQSFMRSLPSADPAAIKGPGELALDALDAAIEQHGGTVAIAAAAEELRDVIGERMREVALWGGAWRDTVREHARYDWAAMPGLAEAIAGVGATWTTWPRLTDQAETLSHVSKRREAIDAVLATWARFTRAAPPGAVMQAVALRPLRAGQLVRPGDISIPGRITGEWPTVCDGADALEREHGPAHSTTQETPPLTRDQELALVERCRSRSGRQSRSK